MPAPSFADRLIAMMQVAVDEQRSPERRADLLNLTIQGATVAEIRQVLVERHGIRLPARVRREDAVARLRLVLGI